MRSYRERGLTFGRGENIDTAVKSTYQRWLMLWAALLIIRLWSMQEPQTVYAQAPPPDAEISAVGDSNSAQVSTVLQPLLAGNFRWLDIADQPYGTMYRTTYDYSHAQVEFIYPASASVF